MFLGFSTFTWIHTLLSIAALVAGVIVVRDQLKSQVTPIWTEVYIASLAATCLTGFGFDFPFGPAHVIGILTLILLGAAIAANYVFHLAGPWRWVYAAGMVVSCYFNFFVLVVQLFRKVPFLRALAPTESEPPFAIAQVVLLLIFAWFTYAAVKRFRPAVAA